MWVTNSALRVTVGPNFFGGFCRKAFCFWGAQSLTIKTDDANSWLSQAQLQPLACPIDILTYLPFFLFPILTRFSSFKTPQSLISVWKQTTPTAYLISVHYYYFHIFSIYNLDYLLYFASETSQSMTKQTTLTADLISRCTAASSWMHNCRQKQMHNYFMIFCNNLHFLHIL